MSRWFRDQVRRDRSQAAFCEGFWDGPTLPEHARGLRTVSASVENRTDGAADVRVDLSNGTDQTLPLTKEGRGWVVDPVPFGVRPPG